MQILGFTITTECITDTFSICVSKMHLCKLTSRYCTAVVHGLNHKRCQSRSLSPLMLEGNLPFTHHTESGSLSMTLQIISGEQLLISAIQRRWTYWGQTYVEIYLEHQLAPTFSPQERFKQA